MRSAKYGVAQIPLPVGGWETASDINQTDITLNPAFNANGHGLCPRELEQWEQAALLQDKLMQGNEQKVYKCTVADPNLQQLCLWKLPCRSAKLTAWYSSCSPNLSFLPCRTSTHTRACACCNSRLSYGRALHPPLS